MNQMEALDEGMSKISKGQLGVVATLLTSLVTAVYGYGSLTNQLSQTMEVVQEMREDLRTLQETKFMTNEAIRQISEVKLMIGKLEGRITYIERDGLKILAGAKDEERNAQRAHGNPD